MGSYMIKSVFNLIDKISEKFNSMSSNVNPGDLSHLIRGEYVNINRILSPSDSIKYVIKTSTLGDIATTVLGPAKVIRPFIKNIKKNTYIDRHEVLDFLKKPNDEQSYTDFIYEILFQKLFTNNVFVEKIGTENTFELYPVKPNFISVSGGAKKLNYQLYASQYYDFLNGDFEGKNGSFISNFIFKKLYHFKGMSNSDGYYGLSPLNSILYEIELANAINDYNISLLGNGANLSGLFTLDSNNPDDLKRLKHDTETKFGGTRNAGKFLVTLGKSVDFKPFGATNKEMAFGEFLDKSEQKIYTSFDIPLPLIKQDSMTYNNYETANYILYICLILPLINDVFNYLTKIFRENGWLSEDEEVSFNTEDIDILKFKSLERIKDLEGIATINELRAPLGLKEKPEYDKLLVKTNQIDIENLIKNSSISTPPNKSGEKR